MYVVFLKVITFSWRTLVLYPGNTSLFLETVTIIFFFWGGGGLRAEGREKQIPVEFQNLLNTRRLYALTVRRG